MANLSYKRIIEKNINWFKNSGVLVNGGRDGVHERVWLLPFDHPIVNKNLLWQDNIFQYRRLDCALETALAFKLSGEILEDDNDIRIAKRLINFSYNTPFQEKSIDNQDFGFYAHGLSFYDVLPKEKLESKNIRKFTDKDFFWDKKWVDDNSISTLLSLYFWYEGFGEDILLEKSLLNGEAMLNKKKILNDYCRDKIDVPHWGGMRNMTLAYIFS